MPTEFDWDETKNVSNLRKHGVDFDAAIDVFLGDYVLREDRDGDYGEQRWVAIGFAMGELLTVVFTERGDVTRIISARKSTAHERRTYRQEVAP